MSIVGTIDKVTDALGTDRIVRKGSGSGLSDYLKLKMAQDKDSGSSVPWNTIMLVFAGIAVLFGGIYLLKPQKTNMN
jgi:hypothetical protein